MASFFKVREGHEVRGLMIKLYPTEEQDAALRSIEVQVRSVWNWLVKQTEDVLAARAAYAVQRGLVPSCPERPDYSGMSPDESKATREAHGRLMLEWHGKVHAATKNDPACAFRKFSDELAHHDVKHDYQLFKRALAWWAERQETPPPTSPVSGVLQAIAKNYFQKSNRRKKFRRRQDPMPIQTRTGTCFRLGSFGDRRGQPFYNCQVSINGLKIRGRLPGHAPQGRVLEGVSLTRKADGWWASIKQEVPVRVLPPPVPGRTVGIDVGLVLIAATSDGLKLPNPRGAEYAERLAGRQALGKPTGRMQLSAARRVRHDLYSKLLPAVATAEVIKIERLQPKLGQMGSDKVSAIRLVRSMLVDRFGHDRVREVEPHFTSQDCSQCGHRSKESWSYEHGRVGQCPACGYREDRDVNAARNIAAKPATTQSS